MRLLAIVFVGFLAVSQAQAWWPDVGGWVSGAAKGIGNAVSSVASGAGNLAAGAISGAGSLAGGAINAAGALAAGAGNLAWEGTKGAANLAAGAVQGAGNLALGAAQGVGNLALGAAQGAGNLALGAGGLAVGAFNEAGKFASGAVQGAGTVLWGAGTLATSAGHLLFGGNGGVAAPGKCEWKQKDIGLIGGTVNAVGQAAGALIGGIWGIFTPTSMNAGAIEAAGGTKDKSNSGGLSVVTNLGGRGIGGIWGAIVPNSVRCGSIAGAQTTGNVGGVNRDPACDTYHWVDDKGNTCTPSKEEVKADGHTDQNVETIGDSINLSYKDTKTGEQRVQALLARWQAILAKHGVSSKDVTIIIYIDVTSDNVNHVVTYAIKFKRPSSQSIVIADLAKEFDADIKSKPIPGLTPTSEKDDPLRVAAAPDSAEGASAAAEGESPASPEGASTAAEGESAASPEEGASAAAEGESTASPDKTKARHGRQWVPAL